MTATKRKALPKAARKSRVSINSPELQLWALEWFIKNRDRKASGGMYLVLEALYKRLLKEQRA